MTGPQGLAARTFEEINDIIKRSIRSDPKTRELLGLTRQVRSLGTDEARNVFSQSITVAAYLLSQTKAGQILSLAECGRLVYQYATAEFLDDGTAVPGTITVLATAVPGIEGRPIWVLDSPEDVAVMAAGLGPDQVWVRADSSSRMTGRASARLRGKRLARCLARS